MGPKEQLNIGVEILNPYLNFWEFKFELMGGGKGSGGDFAWGQFQRDERKIELHFRRSLGGVTYKVRDLSLSHVDYFDILDKKGFNRYPDFSEDVVESFNLLLSDIEMYLCYDFIFDEGKIFKLKGVSKIKKYEEEQYYQNKRWSGDNNTLKQARSELRLKNYKTVQLLEKKIHYPDLLTDSERKMFQISRIKLRETP